MPIFVKMFNNRFVLESPGGFPPPVTTMNIYELHNPRNPHLMYALFYLDYVKCAQEGTKRMREVMGEANLPAPSFAQKEVGAHQVQVTLLNNYEARKTFVDAEAIRLVGAALFEKLGERERVVVNYAAERGNLNVSDTTRILKSDWRTARNILDNLCTKQILQRVSSGKQRDPSSRYVLITKVDDGT